MSELRKTITIVNERGLHARAAAKFVKLAGAFDAEIAVHKNDMTVSGVSIMGLMMLAAAEAIAGVVTDDQLNPSFIIPSVFHPDVPTAVATAIREG